MAMASARTTHFAEHHVNRIVGDNLCDLLKHCSDSDRRVSKDAHLIVLNYGRSGLPWVQKKIAAAMQCLAEDLLSASAEISKASVRRVYSCLGHLSGLSRSLERPEHQVWVSMFTRILSLPQFAAGYELIVNDLMLLWRSDDDPRRTYAGADQQILGLERSTASESLREKLNELRHDC